VFAVSGSISPSTGQLNGLLGYINRAGLFEIRQIGGTLSDINNAAWSGFGAAYVGQRGWLEVRFAPGVNPVIRWNGLDISGNFTFTNSGTPPGWLGASLNAASHVTGFNWPASPAPLGCWLNAHLTDAESEAWRITGQPPAWVALGGYAASKINSPGRNSDFGDGATDWAVLGGATAAVVSGALNVTTGGVNARITLDPALWSLGSPSVVGGVYEFSFVVTNWSVTGTSQVSPGLTNVDAYAAEITGNGTYTGTVTSRAAIASLQVRQMGSGSASFTLDNFVVRQRGALSLPIVLPIAALGDGTILGDNPARLVGIQPVTTRKNWQLTARTATSGNEQLLGGSFLNAARDVLDNIEQTPETGTPTTTVGSASAGAQYKASGALAAAINTPALVTRKTASANVWVGSSTADPIRTTITGHSI